MHAGLLSRNRDTLLRGSASGENLSPSCARPDSRGRLSPRGLWRACLHAGEAPAPHYWSLKRLNNRYNRTAHCAPSFTTETCNPPTIANRTQLVDQRPDRRTLLGPGGGPDRRPAASGIHSLNHCRESAEHAICRDARERNCSSESSRVRGSCRRWGFFPASPRAPGWAPPRRRPNWSPSACRRS